jgi:hypothetical protein
MTLQPEVFQATSVPFSSPLQGTRNAAQDLQGPYREADNLDQG